MGRRIAFGCILGQVETCLFDSVHGVGEQAVKAVQALIADRVGTKLNAAGEESAASLLSYANSVASCVAGVDLVIETVPENVEVKRRVFAEVDSQAERQLMKTYSKFTGAGVNFTNTTFDDAGLRSINSFQSRAPFTGTFRPAQPLSTLPGKPVTTAVLANDTHTAGGAGLNKASVTSPTAR